MTASICSSALAPSEDLDLILEAVVGPGVKEHESRLHVARLAFPMRKDEADSEMRNAPVRPDGTVDARIGKKFRQSESCLVARILRIK